MENKYPECQKLHDVSEESQKIGFFLEWLFQKYTLCKWEDSLREEVINDDGEKDHFFISEGYYPVRKSIQTLLAEYFEIDMNKVDEERAEILKSLREGDLK